MSYHTFVEKGFQQVPRRVQVCEKKDDWPIPEEGDSYTWHPGPDFCGFLLHCRVDVFLNAGYVCQRYPAFRLRWFLCRSPKFNAIWTLCGFQDFFGDVRDCMDSVCNELQHRLCVSLSFHIDNDVDSALDAAQDTSVHIEKICNRREERTSC